MQAVYTEHLTKTFGAVQALSGLDLALDAGCVFGFLGPNGAGKTTTVRLLNGTLLRSSGTARVLGLDPRDEAVRCRTATLSELSGMYESLTVRRNLRLFATLYGLARPAADARIGELADRLNLADRLDARLGTLSTGYKKRVQLARVLLPRPELMFLDEPTEGLDPESATDVARLVRTLAVEDGTTVFLCTHNLPLAEGICDRFGFIRDGRLVAQGTADQVVQTAQPDLKVEIVTAEGHHVLPIADRSEIDGHVGQLRQAGEHIHEVKVLRPSLLDAYLHHVGRNHA